MDQLNREQKDLYTKALRQNKDTFLIYAQKNFGLPADSIQNLASRIDVNINQVNTPNFNIDDAGNVPYVQGVGSTGQTIYNIRNKKKGKDEIITQNLDDIAHYYMKWVYNNLPESEASQQPTATPGYKFVKQEAPKKEGSTQGSEGSSEGGSSGDSTGTEDKTTAEDKKDDKQSKIENPYYKGENVFLMESSPVMLYNKLAPELQKDEPEFKHLYQWIRNTNFDSKPDSETFKTHIGNSLVYDNISQSLGNPTWVKDGNRTYIPFIIGYNKSLGINDNNKNYKFLFPSELEANAPETIKSLYKDTLSKFKADAALNKNLWKYEYSGFNDLVKLRLSLGNYNLLPYEKYDINENIFKITPDITKPSYFVLPGQLSKDNPNSQYLWTVEINPKTNKLKYVSKSLGTIIDDLTKDTNWDINTINSILKTLNNYKFDSTQNYIDYDDSINTIKSIVKNQLGGTVDAPIKDIDYNYQIHNYHNQKSKDAFFFPEKYDYKTAYAKSRPVDNDNWSVNHPDAGFTWQDSTRLGAAVADLTSAVLNVTGAGVPLAAATGLAGTTANAIADFTDPAVTLKEAFYNTGLNLGTDALALIPEIGAATKVAKAVATLGKYAGPILLALNSYGLYNEASSFKKLFTDEPISTEDMRHMLNALTQIAGLTSAGKSVVKRQLSKNNWTESTNKVGVKVQDAEGNIQHLVVEGNDATALKNAKSLKEQNDILENMFGSNSFKVVNDPNWTPGWKPTEWFKTTNNPLRPVKENLNTNELYIEGKTPKKIFGTESDIIVDHNVVGKPKVDNKGNKVLNEKGKPVTYTAKDAENFTPNIKRVFSAVRKDRPVTSFNANKNGSKSTSPINRETLAKDINLKNEKYLSNQQKKLQKDYDSQRDNLEKSFDSTDPNNVIHKNNNIEINGKLYNYDEAKQYLEKLRKAYNSTNTKIPNNNQELTKSIKEASTEYREALQKTIEDLKKSFSNNSSKIKQLDYSTNLFINGKNYKIENIPNVKQYTPEELTEALKINLKKTGGKIDFDIYKKFINKYGSI